MNCRKERFSLNDNHNQTQNVQIEWFHYLPIALGLAMVATILMWFNQRQSIQDLETQVEAHQAQIAEIQEHNEQVRADRATQSEFSDIENVLDPNNDVINKLFNWSSWEDYANNMRAIGEQYPMLAQDSRVDTDALTIGRGDAPNNSFNVSGQYVGTQANSMASIIQQTQRYSDTRRSQGVFLLTTYLDNNGQLNVGRFTPLRSQYSFSVNSSIASDSINDEFEWSPKKQENPAEKAEVNEPLFDEPAGRTEGDPSEFDPTEGRTPPSSTQDDE